MSDDKLCLCGRPVTGEQQCSVCGNDICAWCANNDGLCWDEPIPNGPDAGKKYVILTPAYLEE